MELQQLRSRVAELDQKVKIQEKLLQSNDAEDEDEFAMHEDSIKELQELEVVHTKSRLSMSVQRMDDLDQENKRNNKQMKIYEQQLSELKIEKETEILKLKQELSEAQIKLKQIEESSKIQSSNPANILNEQQLSEERKAKEIELINTKSQLEEAKLTIITLQMEMQKQETLVEQLKKEVAGKISYIYIYRMTFTSIILL